MKVVRRSWNVFINQKREKPKKWEKQNKHCDACKFKKKKISEGNLICTKFNGLKYDEIWSILICALLFIMMDLAINFALLISAI